MTNVRTIHVDWYSQCPPRFNGGPQLAYQGDHLSNMVVFDNAPELPNYYLLVEMKIDEAGPVVALPDILLEGPYWVIPNYYTQICQLITYQVCCKTGSGDYEHHSAKFKGTILPVITHNGEPIDQTPMFDPYMDILDKRVNELVVAAGDIQIDSELKNDSGNPVQNRIVKAAIDGLEEDVAEVNGRLLEQAKVIDRKVDKVFGGEITNVYVPLISGKGLSSVSWTYVNQPARAATNPIEVEDTTASASIASGYKMYIYGNNTGVDGELNKIAGWVTTVDLTNVPYSYLCIVIKRTDEGDITSDDLSEVLTLSSYSTVLSFALAADLQEVSDVATAAISDVDERLTNFIGIVDFTIEKGSLNSVVGADSPTISSYNSGTRARIPIDNPLHLAAESVIKIGTGYQIYPIYNDGNGLVRVGWISGKYTVPVESDVWFIIKPVTEVSGDTIPLETFQEQITVVSGEDNTFEKRMSAVEAELANIDGGSSGTSESSVISVASVIPEYYEEHLAGKIDEINEETAFINGICFSFVTDMHFTANSKNSKYLLKEILNKTPCDIVIGGGDYGVTSASEEVSRSCIATLLDYAGYIGHDKWFPTEGNHDFTGSEPLTWGDTYNAIYRPSERWVVDSECGGWFCVENKTQKTRIICLNSCCPSSFDASTVMDGLVRIGYAQSLFLVNKLSEGSGWHNFVVSHIASDPEMRSYTANMAGVQTILETFVAKGTGSITAGGRSIALDFSNTTNELIAHLSGHSHRDQAHVSNNVLSISTTCDAYYQDDGYGAAAGTITEQAFDVFCIDYDTKTIKAIRVGRGTNREWSYA